MKTEGLSISVIEQLSSIYKALDLIPSFAKKQKKKIEKKKWKDDWYLLILLKIAFLLYFIFFSFIYSFIFEAGSLSDAQAGVELLGSSDSPTSASTINWELQSCTTLPNSIISFLKRNKIR